jgi:prophage antirepressor-like protein
MTIKNARAGQGFAQPENSSDDISVIKFEDAKVRIVKINGEPWFVAADVCAALEISNSQACVAGSG